MNTAKGRGPSQRGREIIELRQAGMKQAAIAVRLGVTLGTVKQALRRHRRRAGNNNNSGYGYSILDCQGVVTQPYTVM